MPLVSLAAAATSSSSSSSSLTSSPTLSLLLWVLARDLPAPAEAGLAVMFSGPDVGPVKFTKHKNLI